MENSIGSVIKNWFKTVWVEGNENAIDELMDENAIIHYRGEEPKRGIRAFKKTYKQLHELFDRFEIVVSDVDRIDNEEKAHCRFSAWPHGSEKAITVEGDAWVRVKDGKIIECSNDFDAELLDEMNRLALAES